VSASSEDDLTTSLQRHVITSDTITSVGSILKHAVLKQFPRQPRANLSTSHRLMADIFLTDLTNLLQIDMPLLLKLFLLNYFEYFVKNQLSAISSGIFSVCEEHPSCQVLPPHVNNWHHIYWTPLAPIPVDDFVFEFLTKILYLLFVFSCFLYS
jgi:hypothetical protein